MYLVHKKWNINMYFSFIEIRVTSANYLIDCICDEYTILIITPVCLSIWPILSAVRVCNVRILQPKSQSQPHDCCHCLVRYLWLQNIDIFVCTILSCSTSSSNCFSSGTHKRKLIELDIISNTDKWKYKYLLVIYL